MSKAAQFADTARTIACIGRNYVAHAKELNNPLPAKPFFFLKPPSAILKNGGTIQIPKGADVHHELELAVIMKGQASRVDPSNAMDYVAGYTVAIDLTARNFQSEAKTKGLPWTASKGYDTFLPVGSFIPAEQIEDPHNLELWLKVNGETKQQGNTNLMIFQIPQLIAAVSDVMTLNDGDIICTGTPEGVASIKADDIITAGIGDIESVQFSVQDRQ